MKNYRKRNSSFLPASPSPLSSSTSTAKRLLASSPSPPATAAAATTAAASTPASIPPPETPPTPPAPSVSSKGKNDIPINSHDDIIDTTTKKTSDKKKQSSSSTKIPSNSSQIKSTPPPDSLSSKEIINSDILSSSSKNPNIADGDDYDYNENNHHTQDKDDSSVDHRSVPPDFFNILSTFPLFKQAPKSFHSKVVSKLKLMQYHPQEYIIKEGDPSISMYWILKGTVSVTSTDGESIYAELAGGSFFGEIGILFNRPRTATVVARTKVLVGVLTSDALNVVLKSYPLIERRIRDEAQERLSMQDKKNKAELPPVLKSKHSAIKSNLSKSNRVSSFASSSSSSSKVAPRPANYKTNHSATASTMANLSSPIPGPSIPPIDPSPLSQTTTFPSDASGSSSIPLPPPPPLSASLSYDDNSQISSTSTFSTSTAADNIDQTISIQEFIKSLPMFRNLTSHIIHRLALGVEPLTFQPFEYVFRKNDTSRDIYFIVNGEVEVVDHLNSDLKVDNILARLKPGSCFGEMAFLSFLNNEGSYYRSASVRTVTLVELIVVRCDHLKLICDKYPFIIDEMKNTASQRRSLNSSLYLNNSNLMAASTAAVRSLDLTPLSPSNTGSPSRRLSINFLMNDGTPPNSNTTVNDNSNTVQAPQAVTQSIFSPNWGFNSNFGSQSMHSTDNSTSVVSSTFSMDRGRLSRSISPISGVDVTDVSKTSPPQASTQQHQTIDKSISRKRKSISAGPLQPLQQIQQSIQTHIPPLNPVVPSINNFQNFQPGSRRSSFQYMPHSKRVKLATLNGGRRRSSILSVNGPLPDKILLRVFEYLTLPELMKLRIVSRRWRQLVYVAPNLCTHLDLNPWNTSIDDRALISITDFVGSRPQYIDISHCFHITDEGFTYMVNEIGISGRIKTLKMRSNWEVSAMAIMDLTVPSVGRYLEEIDLSNCRKVRDNVIERLIGWDPESSGPEQPSQEQENQQRFLQLQQALGNLEDQDLFNNDVGCKNLKILSAGYCKHLTDDVMYHIANHANKRLESLDLTRCTTITDKGFQYWTYRSFSNLKKLSLKDCTFLTDNSIISIANAAPNLEILDLNFCCALSDIAIEVLCLGCQNLRELDLSFCGSAVSDSSLVAISLHLRNLQKLILKGCIRVTRAGIDALLSGCSPLNYINVSQCRNAHIYPGRIPAQKLNVNPHTKSAFVTAGPFQNVIEIVI